MAKTKNENADSLNVDKINEAKAATAGGVDSNASTKEEKEPPRILTQAEKEDLKTLQESFGKTGFELRYNAALANAIEKKLSQPEFEPWYKPVTDRSMMVLEPIAERSAKDDKLYLNGFYATFLKEGQDPKTQYFQNYKFSGATVENAEALLQGRAAVVTEWVDGRKGQPGERRYNYVELDLSVTPKEGENYPIALKIRRNDVDLSKLYSSEKNIIADGTDKEKHLQALEAGQRVEVVSRELVPGSRESTRPTKLYLDLNIGGTEEKRSLIMNVTNADGVVLRNPEILVREAAVKKAEGMLIGDAGKERLSDNMKALLSANGGEKTPRIGQGARRAAS